MNYIEELIEKEKKLIQLATDLNLEQYTLKNNEYYTCGYNFMKKVNNYELYIGIEYNLWKKFKKAINIYVCKDDNEEEFTFLNKDNLEFESFQFLGDEIYCPYFAQVLIPSKPNLPLKNLFQEIESYLKQQE